MKEYIICGKDGTSAAILPEKGATVVSFRHKDVEFLYKDEENLNSSERPNNPAKSGRRPAADHGVR